MKEFKGTPGPWSVNVIGQHWNNKSLTHIEVTFGQDGECICDTVYNPSDAKLISAAPDLLEALDKLAKEYIFTRGQLNGDTEEELADVLCIKNARAAISKAMGE